MARVLTDSMLKNLKPPASGRIEVVDTRCQGLAFRVTDKGARSFSFRFRDPETGIVGRSTLGRFPDLTLSKARRKADELRASVADGVNPAKAKRMERLAASARSFDAVADRYLKEHAERHKKASSAAEDRRNLKLHVRPYWKDRRLDKIERADVVEITERLASDGKPVLANRVQALISSVFSFAIDAGLVKANPCTRLRKRGVETPATRTLSDDEIRFLWPRCVLSPLSRRAGLALRLILLTGARPGEVAGMRCSELEHLTNRKRAIWTVPAERSKNGRAHVVPLSDLARETILDAIDLIDPDGDLLFPSPKNNGNNTRAHSLTVGMKRLTGFVKGPVAKTWKPDPPTPHDLRRTVATRLSKLGTPPEDVSAVLNHVRRDVTGRVYDQHARLDEKRRALNAWADQLKLILKRRPQDART